MATPTGERPERSRSPLEWTDIRDLDQLGEPWARWAVDDVGAKAAALARARAAGMPVLPGFVVTTAAAAAAADPGHPAHAASLGAVRGAVDRLVGRLRPGSLLVVRSSSPIEDGSVSSQAGRFHSALDVRPDDLPDALVDVVASADGAPMAVLVQPQLEARAGGVLFGVDPVGANPGALVLAAVPDAPAGLVSGTLDGVTVPLSRRGRPLGPHPDWLTPGLLRSLAKLAHATEDLFGGPQDIEWAQDRSGTLRLLQSRPVTATAQRLPRPARGSHILGAGPVAETFPDPLTALEQDLWIPPLTEGISTALRIVGGASRRQLARTPPVQVVADRAVADLELLGAARRHHRGWALVDPRPGLRRLTSAWRVGRLRAALPALAAETIADLDELLAAVPPLAELDEQSLLGMLRRAAQALSTVHGYEALAGILGSRDAPPAPGGGRSGQAATRRSADTFAGAPGAALRALRAEQDSDVPARRLLADHPVLLALTAPTIPPVDALPPLARALSSADSSAQLADTAGDDPHPGAYDLRVQREALRLRARWLHELTALAATELGRRLASRGLLPEAGAVSGLRLSELAELVTDPAAASLGSRALAGGEPAVPRPSSAVDPRPVPVTLPPAFRLSTDGDVVPTRLAPGEGKAAPGGLSGTPAGGGIGAGIVHQGDAPPAGAVLVVDTLAPRLAGLLPGLAALVSATGSPLSHLAILAREFGVPTVVGVPDALRALPDGSHVVVDGRSGRIDVVPDTPPTVGTVLPAPREHPADSPARQELSSTGGRSPE